MEEAEINSAETENSIHYDSCSTWWHLPCAELTVHCAESLDSWLCFSCLVDNADSHDNGSSKDDDDDDDESSVGEHSGASTLQNVQCSDKRTNINVCMFVILKTFL